MSEADATTVMFSCRAASKSDICFPFTICVAAVSASVRLRLNGNWITLK